MWGEGERGAAAPPPFSTHVVGHLCATGLGVLPGRALRVAMATATQIREEWETEVGGEEFF